MDMYMCAGGGCVQGFEKKHGLLTPLWILLSTLAISKIPASENAACHLLALKVCPDCKKPICRD